MSRLDVHVGGSFADTKRRLLDAVARAERGEVAGETHITFETWEALAAVMTPERFELVHHLHRSPEASVAALARSLGRDDERVHEDVEALVEACQERAAANIKTISEVLAELDPSMVDRFETLRAFLAALGDDVQETTLRFYIAFKRIKNFACVEFRPSAVKILIFVKVDPNTVELEAGFTRDVSKVGYFGTGDLEITLTKSEDLERAKPLILRSYEAS